MNIPCDRCLKPVLTSVSFDIDDTVEMEENASEDEEPEEKDYIDGYTSTLTDLFSANYCYPCQGKSYVKMTARDYVLFAEQI